MSSETTPIIEMPDVSEGTYYYIDADAWKVHHGNGWERVLPPEYTGYVIVCSVGMKEYLQKKMTG